MPRSTHERLQSLIFALEQGAGAAALKLASVVLAFALLALFYHSIYYHGFAGQEGMENAQIARQLSEGHGYSTTSIRPFALGLLDRADSGAASQALRHDVPDLSVAPGYPALLSLVMEILPFHFTADRNQPGSYQPEILITIFNEVLLFLAALLVFLVARRLFEPAVGWLAAIIFSGTEMYWKFSLSGLSTIWLIVVFLGLVWCLLVIEERERQTELPGLGGSLAWAAAAGALVGIGGLSRYSFGLMIIPILIFLSRYGKRVAGKASLCATAIFLIFMGPWIARNIILSHSPFGTSGYAIFQETIPALEHDRLERMFNPNTMLGKVTVPDVTAKFIQNTGEMLKNDVPRMAGNWVSAFFICGLLLPFRSLGLRRMRYFLVWSLVLMAFIQPLGQTHLTADSPEFNSENLLAVLTPLVLIFGTGFFFTLLDQMALADPKARSGVVGLFGVVMCGPLLLALLGTPPFPTVWPYAPLHLRRTAGMMKSDELMMSDIPWAVAWYGERPCAWLTLDDAGTFREMNEIKPIKAVFLTQQTTEQPFWSQMLYNQDSWGFFLLNSLPPNDWPAQEVPTGFPLKNAALDYFPEQMFISDTIRWRTSQKR